MTPADLARQNAITFECKKDTLRQNQSGDWKIAFTVQGLDMDERLTKAFPGTRYQAVLVEIDDSEMPVSPTEAWKLVEKRQKMDLVSPAEKENVATPPVTKPPPEAKREISLTKRPRDHMDWRELQPAAQAGIRCQDPVFKAFLEEQFPDEWREEPDPVDCVYLICGISSRTELSTDHRKRILWHQLDEQFLAWKMKERA